MGIFSKHESGGERDVDLTATSAPTWGRPTRCPHCGGPGYLDRIDLVDRVMWQHCPGCRGSWSTSESECAPAGGGRQH